MFLSRGPRPATPVGPLEALLCFSLSLASPSASPPGLWGPCASVAVSSYFSLRVAFSRLCLGVTTAAAAWIPFLKTSSTGEGTVKSAELLWGVLFPFPADIFLLNFLST